MSPIAAAEVTAAARAATAASKGEPQQEGRKHSVFCLPIRIAGLFKKFGRSIQVFAARLTYLENIEGKNERLQELVPRSEHLDRDHHRLGASDRLERVMASGKRSRLRVGPTIVGSFIAGLASAMILTLIVFAGARENVIGGVALLAFAASWALIAACSTLWSDQPQRWAAASAAVFAIWGGTLLLWPKSVEIDALQWLWPPLLLILDAWMTWRAHRELRSRVRNWVLYPLFAVLAMAAVGGLLEMANETQERKSLPLRGQMVDIGGRQLHLRCSGSGSPTVVLLPGFAEFSSAWGWIEPEVARNTQVCVYDRAGRAWSDAASRPQDAIDLADDLHSLLKNAGVQRPVVLAGHSFGGLYTLTYAHRYPEDVAGVVLLDSTSPQMFTRVRVYPRFYDGYRRISALFPSLSRIGIARLVYRSSFTSLPEPAAADEIAFASTARAARSQRDEWAQAPIAMRQANALETLGNRPLVVVTAMRDQPDGWPAAQKDLARLSSNSVHRVAPDASHASLVGDRQRSAISVRAIDEVVVAVRDGLRLQL